MKNEKQQMIDKLNMYLEMDNINPLAWKDGYTHQDVSNVLGWINMMMDDFCVFGHIHMVWDKYDRLNHLFHGSSELWIVNHLENGMEVSIPLMTEDGIEKLVTDLLSFRDNNPSLTELIYHHEETYNVTLIA